MLSVIRQDVRADYVAVPALLDGRGTDVVLIEHEYGIFGGEAGSYVLSLVQELRQPFVVTLHTVLSAPTARQAEVLGELCQRAALVTVFTETARRMVVDAGVVTAGPGVRGPARRSDDPAAEHRGRDCCRRCRPGCRRLAPDDGAPRGSHRAVHLRADLRRQGHRNGHRGARR